MFQTNNQYITISYHVIAQLYIEYPLSYMCFLPTYTDWDAGKCAGNHISKMIKKKRWVSPERKRTKPTH